MINWTDDLIKRLTELHLQGFSARQISVEFYKEFGIYATKGSVLGKLFRLRKGGSFDIPSGGVSDVRTKQAKKEVGKKIAQEFRARKAIKIFPLNFESYNGSRAVEHKTRIKKLRIQKAEIPTEFFKSFIDRRMYFECSWIDGDPRTESVCCGAPTEKLQNFCNYHRSKVYSNVEVVE